MAFTSQLPRWNAEGIKPPQSLQDTGWEASQKPPAEYFNWFQYTAYNALLELQQKAGEVKTVNGQSPDENGNVTIDTATKWTELQDKPNSSPGDIDKAVTNEHTHDNKNVLDNTTAPYTLSAQNKLSSIEEGAEVNKITSVNGKTGDVTVQGFSGNYNDLSNKPSIPNKASDIGAETPSAAQEKADQAESNAKEYALPETSKGEPGGVASLDGNGHVLPQQLDLGEVVNKPEFDEYKSNNSYDKAKMNSNIVDLAIELETMKAAELTGVDANIFIETFQNLDDVVLDRGGYDSANNQLEV